MSHRPARLLAIPLVAALLGVGAFGYWKSVHDRLPEGISQGNGRLEATEVQIASKYPGRLAEVRVDEGDRVEKGQLLARLDTRTLEAQRDQASAEVLRARENLAAALATVDLRASELRLAEQEFKRFRELFQRGHTSRQMLDQQQNRHDTASAALNAANAQVSAARAAIGAAEAQVAQLTSEIDDSSLLAPMPGIVQLRLAEPGEVLGAGGRVLLLIEHLPAGVAALEQLAETLELLFGQTHFAGAQVHGGQGGGEVLPGPQHFGAGLVALGLQRAGIQTGE